MKAEMLLSGLWCEVVQLHNSDHTDASVWSHAI